jgi:hypothetical protein
MIPEGSEAVVKVPIHGREVGSGRAGADTQKEPTWRHVSSREHPPRQRDRIRQWDLNDAGSEFDGARRGGHRSQANQGIESEIAPTDDVGHPDAGEPEALDVFGALGDLKSTDGDAVARQWRWKGNTNRRKARLCHLGASSVRRRRTL